MPMVAMRNQRTHSRQLPRVEPPQRCRATVLSTRTPVRRLCQLAHPVLQLPEPPNREAGHLHGTQPPTSTPQSARRQQAAGVEMRERRNDGADRHHVGHQAAVATSTKGKSAIADTMPLSAAATEHSLMPAARTKRRTDPAHGRRQSHVSRTSHSSSRKNPEGRQLEISHWTCHPWPLSEPPGLRRSSSPPPIAQRRFAPSGAPVSSVPPLICGAAVATLFR